MRWSASRRRVRRLWSYAGAVFLVMIVTAAIMSPVQGDPAKTGEPERPLKLAIDASKASRFDEAIDILVPLARAVPLLEETT